MTAPTRAIPNPQIEPTIDVGRAAAVLGVGLSTGYDQVERGLWPAIRVGRTIRIPTAKWLRTVGLADEQEAG